MNNVFLPCMDYLVTLGCGSHVYCRSCMFSPLQRLLHLVPSASHPLPHSLSPQLTHSLTET